MSQLCEMQTTLTDVSVCYRAEDPTVTCTLNQNTQKCLFSYLVRVPMMISITSLHTQSSAIFLFHFFLLLMPFFYPEFCYKFYNSPSDKFNS